MASDQAAEELEGGWMGRLERSIAESESAKSAEGFRGLAENLMRVDIVAGELGKTPSIDGKKPREIEWALRARLIEDKIPLPSISRTYDPGIDPDGTV